MIVRLAITALILAILAIGIDMRESARAIAEVDPRYLAAVLALVAVDRIVMILRWILLLRARGIGITTGNAVKLFLVSSFVGSFLPAGIGGDAVRAYGLARDAAAGSDAVASVAVDRLLGVLSLVVMAIIGAVAWTPEGRSDWRIAGAIVALTLASGAAFWANELLRRIIPDSRQGRFFTRRLLKIADAVGRYRSHRGVLVHVLGWSIVVQVLRVTQAYLLGLGLGMTVPYGYFLLFMPLGLLMLLLPISISGFGVPQGIIVWLLRPVGVADSQSFALSTLIVLTGLAGNLPGLWLWLRQRREIL
jgi:glycosyltransferase 2 family protein